MKKVAVLLMAIIMLFATGCGEQRESIDTEVKINTDYNYGEGVIWAIKDRQIIIVTAAHVIEANNGHINVTLSDNTKLECNNFASSQENDLAFLILDTKTSKKLINRIEGPENQNTLDSLLSPEELVYCKSLTDNMDYYGTVIDPSIYVEDFGQYMIYLNLWTTPGMSGSGLYDEEGHFYGLICGGNDEGEAVAISAATIQAEYINSQNF